jgi:1-deoxy-D-xylulose-5-phosphate synthase
MLNDIKSPQDLKKIKKRDLPKLCSEIRERIINVMTKNGGHLASNLGVVELTTAIHYVFNAPEDKIIFDVGHQCYTHKILTGRNNDFTNIRKKGGISGFPRRKESKYDPVDSGHSSTAISSALGFAVANNLQKSKNSVIVVIGDGALTGGEAFEGLNYAGHLELPLIVILNDNDMSISKNVGAVSNFLNKIAVSSLYQNITDFIDKRLKKTSGPIKAILRFLNNLKRGFKYLVEYENVFTSLGFEYIGPINGHDINELIYILSKVKKNIKHPVLLHIKTIKGKGFSFAECNPTDFHGVTPCLMSSGKIEVNEEKTFTEVFSEKIVKMGKAHNNIIAITAAMDSGTGLSLFKSNYPDRFFDVGIAEQHAVTFSASLAYGGFKPVLAIYSTFLQRAIDQIMQDICISKSPVIITIDRAGVVGADGETHQGQFDITYLRMLPNINLLSPCDATELKIMMDYAYNLNEPVAIRYPRDTAQISQLNDFHPPIAENPFIIIKNGSDILIITIGPFVNKAKNVISGLEKENIDAGLIYLRILKPLDIQNLLTEINKYKAILVIEENVFAGSVSEEIGANVAKMDKKIYFDSINLPDNFIEHDTRKNILTQLNFDEEGIYKTVIKLFNKINAF